MNTHDKAPTKGILEVITGCMFSGKTESLIKRAEELGTTAYQAFKPRIDDRYSRTEIVSHNGGKIVCTPVDRAAEIGHRIKPETRLILIDEVQFLDEEIIEILNHWVLKEYHIVVSGLDLDWQGLGFGPMPQILAQADRVDKKFANCAICQSPASRTQRLVANSDDILVGGQEQYEPRCLKHHNPHSVKLAAKRVSQDGGSQGVADHVV